MEVEGGSVWARKRGTVRMAEGGGREVMRTVWTGRKEAVYVYEDVDDVYEIAGVTKRIGTVG